MLGGAAQMAQPKRNKDEGETPAPEGGGAAVATADAVADGPWKAPAQAARTSLIVLAVVVAVLNLPMLHYYLFRGVPPAPVALPYQNDFSNTDLKDFFATGGMWRVENGELVSPGVKNNPLWLKAKLPNDVAVEFDVRSMSPEGDIKAEIFGDGSDHASGYVLIHGGWNNSISIIARLDEHGTPLGQLPEGIKRMNTRTRVEAHPYPVTIGKTYHWRIERRGGLITWFIDGREFMRFDDPKPLTGEQHNRFGFSSWEAQLYFDNLSVTPL